MSAILEGALSARDAGLAVHYQRGKRAFEPGWSTSPPKTAEELRRDYRDGFNIAFRTGEWSTVDGLPIVVLDADIRSDGPEHRQAAREAWRDLVGADGKLLHHDRENLPAPQRVLGR